VNLLNEQLVLVLNSLYIVVGTATIKKALTNLFSTSEDGNMASQGIDIEFELDDDGRPNFDKVSYWEPVNLEAWMNLPVRSWDIPIHTSKRTIRAPIVMRAKNYNGLALRELKLNKRNAYRHYGKKCAYSGKILTLAEASLEHVKPKSHGGKDEWTNIVLAHRDLNSERGNMPIENFRHRLLYEPKKPLPRTAASEISTVPRVEWLSFILKQK